MQGVEARNIAHRFYNFLLDITLKVIFDLPRKQFLKDFFDRNQCVALEVDK